LCKANTKRRRTKEKINQENQIKELRAQDVAQKMNKFAQMQAEIDYLKQ